MELKFEANLGILVRPGLKTKNNKTPNTGAHLPVYSLIEF